MMDIDKSIIAQDKSGFLMTHLYRYNKKDNKCPEYQFKTK